MADDVTFQATVATPPAGTIVAADDVGGVHYQRTKIDLGGDGAASPLVRGQQADASSIPVTLSTQQAVILAAIETAVEAILAAQLPDSHNVTVDNASIAITHAALTELAAAINGSNQVDINVTGISVAAVPVSHAALTELATAIDTEMQVDVVAALPAGDNNIGNVDVVTLPALAAGTNNIGDVDVLSAVATDFEHFGNLDVDTAAEQLTAFACKFGVQIKADDDNTDSVYVGKSDVSTATDATAGFRLKAGQGLFLPVSNANLVYVIGGANNQKIWVAAA